MARGTTSPRQVSPGPIRAGATPLHMDIAQWSAHRTVEGPPPVQKVVGQAWRGMGTLTGATSRRALLFTFDDGPHLTHTPKLLDHLDRYGVKAVFFLSMSKLGGGTKRQRQQRRLAQEIIRRGHVLGNHSFDHEQLPLMSDDQVQDQLEKSEKAFESLVGIRPRLFRPPGGARSPRIDDFLQRRGYTTVLWNLGSGDVQVTTADDVLRTWRRVLQRREQDHGERGGIVLLHDIHAHSVEAFPRIMDDILQRNCALLAEREELYDLVDDLSLFPVSHPGSAPSDLQWEQRQAELRERTARRCLAHGG